MNIRPMLSKKGYKVYEGQSGMIDYDLVEYGKNLTERLGNGIEIMITWNEEQIFIYTFYKDGFSIQRWIK